MIAKASVVTLSGLIAIASLAPIASAETVGAAAAVRPAATGTPPGGGARTLQVGTDIEERERIVTSQGGTVQVMFLDKSTLMIGENSDLLIDQFVYNPNAGTGKFAANLARGALRFVGGQISHTTGVTIDTPTATVGIRGGGGDVRHGTCVGGECTEALAIGGQLTVTSKTNGQRLTLDVGTGARVGSTGPIETFSFSTSNPTDPTGGTPTGEKKTDEETAEQLNAATEKALSEFSQASEPPPPPSPAPSD